MQTFSCIIPTWWIFIVYLLQRVIEKQNKVVITDRMWARLLSSTNQPSFGPKCSSVASAGTAGNSDTGTNETKNTWFLTTSSLHRLAEKIDYFFHVSTFELCILISNWPGKVGTDSKVTGLLGCLSLKEWNYLLKFLIYWTFGTQKYFVLLLWSPGTSNNTPYLISGSLKLYSLWSSIVIYQYYHWNSISLALYLWIQTCNFCNDSFFISSLVSAMSWKLWYYKLLNANCFLTNSTIFYVFVCVCTDRRRQKRPISSFLEEIKERERLISNERIMNYYQKRKNHSLHSIRCRFRLF